MRQHLMQHVFKLNISEKAIALASSDAMAQILLSVFHLQKWTSQLRLRYVGQVQPMLL